VSASRQSQTPSSSGTYRLVHPSPNDPTKLEIMMASGEDWYQAGGWQDILKAAQSGA
jgi:hypothetical protein